MTEPMFRLTQYAADFVTRDLGISLRQSLLDFMEEIPADQQILIDATGVSVMTPSFVDEFFGRTATTLGVGAFKSRFRIVGVDDDTKVLINNVVRNRIVLDRQRQSQKLNEHHKSASET